MLITDRLRLAAALGTGAEQAVDLLLRQIAAAVEAGVDYVQLRERDLSAASLTALAGAASRLVEGTPTRLLVNDRIDVALAAGASGVHLRADSPPPARVRSWVGARCTLGRAVHGPEDVAVARGADYLLAGPVFPTVSKPHGTRWLGIDGLRAVVRASAGVPVLALGGISIEHVRAIATTGAAGIAGIGAFAPAARDEDPAKAMKKFVSAVRLGFDTAEVCS